ncbi:MAG: hypothetical protein ACP5P4_06225 [Steroidobacteraceae bacterium]
MKMLATMCLMGLLAGCASGPGCADRLVPINTPSTAGLHAGASAPVSAVAKRIARSREP